MGRSAAFTGHSSGSSAPIGQIYYKPVTLQTLKNLKESKLEKGFTEATINNHILLELELTKVKRFNRI